MGHGTCLYLRCETSGIPSVRLIVGKGRVAPLAGATVQRMELQGLVQCVRLVRRVLSVLPFNVEMVTMAGDSMVAIMVMQKDGMAFKPFFQNRVVEIT